MGEKPSPVRALEPHVAFYTYTGVLGFALTRRDQESAVLKRDGVQIELVVAPDHDPATSASLPGSRLPRSWANPVRSAGVCDAMRITWATSASVSRTMTRTTCSSAKMKLASTAPPGSTPTVPLFSNGSPVWWCPMRYSPGGVSRARLQSLTRHGRAGPFIR